MAADRSAYEAKQAALLEALLRGGELPEGFAAAKADAASQQLRRKRTGALRHAWPALVVALGARFDERFDAFALAAGPPAFGEGLSDGLAFCDWLAREGDALGDDVRVEELFARAVLVRDRRRGGDWRRRRLFLSAARLRRPARVLVVAHLPRLGRRYVSFGAR